MISRNRIAAEAETFFEWPDENNRTYVTLASCILFTEKMMITERDRWLRIAESAQAVTTDCEDKIDCFEVPSHLMATLVLALDEEPNAKVTWRQAAPQEQRRWDEK